MLDVSADKLERAYSKLEACKLQESALTVEEDGNLEEEELLEVKRIRQRYLKRQAAELDEMLDKISDRQDDAVSKAINVDSNAPVEKEQQLTTNSSLTSSSESPIQQQCTNRNLVSSSKKKVQFATNSGGKSSRCSIGVSTPVNGAIAKSLAPNNIKIPTSRKRLFSTMDSGGENSGHESDRKTKRFKEQMPSNYSHQDLENVFNKGIKF